MKQAMGGAILAAALAAAAPACAGAMSGNPALAFAALVGLQAPRLPAADKHILSAFLAGDTAFASSDAPFRVTSEEVHCRSSDVDITEHVCTLAFGSVAVELSGREGNALLATMALAGVPSDGAAGSIHYDAKAVTCTIDPAAVKSKAGGGAQCSYSQD